MGEITARVQGRLERLQHPSDCRQARIMVVDVDHHECGFSCKVHTLAYIFFFAAASNRTLVSWVGV